MWSSIANLKENLNKIALDVHEDDEEDEDLNIYGSNNGGGDFLDSDRRNSNGFRYSRSVSRSPITNGVESPVNHEVYFLFLVILKSPSSSSNVTGMLLNHMTVEV